MSFCMSINLFTYWEGLKPDYIRLCEKIIDLKLSKNICHHKVNSINVYDYIPKQEFPDNFETLSCLAHKADYIRCLLTYLHGGIWLDLDQVLVTNLDDIYNLSSEYEYITYEWEPLNPSIGFFYASKHNVLMNLWRQKMRQKIESNANLTWESLGYQLLWPVLKNLLDANSLKYLAFPARTSFAPLEWTEQDKFFSTTYEMDFSNLYSVMLYNSQIPQWFKNMSEKEILNSNYFISKLLKKFYEN